MRAVFLDISKAFDKVWHDGLIFKLKQNGVSGSLLMFFQNYFYNRKQRVVLNGSFSHYSTVKSGVPQGSVLGPQLFLMYINDLGSNIKSNIKFFADDTMLYSIVGDSATSANNLDHDFDIISALGFNGKWSLIPIQQNRQLKFYFRVRNLVPIIRN